MKGSIGMILVLFVTSTFGFHTMGLHHMISDHLVKRSPNHIGKIQSRDPWTLIKPEYPTYRFARKAID